MASYLDKAQVNTALTDNTKLDLGHQHITTADFMQLNVSYLHEMVPGEKIDVAMESFARLNPLPVPTFGRAALRNRAFFVPFRTIFRGWNDFITDTVHVASDGYSGSAHLLSTCPYVDMADLCNAFLNSVTTTMDGNGLIMSVTGPGTTSWDFQTGPSNNLSLWNFTIKGRQAIKVLESLGYKLDFDAKAGDFVVSAMPLLALAKVYCDWYFPQQYSNISIYDNLLAMCNLDVYNGPIKLTATQVATILTACSFVQYDSDYFVSAWDQPNQPNAGNYSTDFKLVNIDKISSVYTNAATSGESRGYVTNNSGSTSSANRLGGADAPFISPYSPQGNSSYQVTAISEYLLHGLHALTDYMKRHQLAGSRAFDRYLARFGKALSAEKMNRSNYLGAAVQDIQIGDIMSTSDTIDATAGTGAQLGGYAGKGISYGNGHFDFSTDEFGYFIIVSSIVPATGYFQGIDRQVMRTTKLQFFTPEFDSLGSQPITADELFIPQGTAIMTNGDPHTQIFGFTPRYADYKVAHDQLTGNFRLASINSGLGGFTLNASNSWHLMREFNGSQDFNADWEDVVHTPDFISGLGDFSQYKRIFYNDDPDAPDNFTVIHNFEIAAFAPMKALYDSYEFEDKGKKVTLETNGVKMN